MLDLHEGAAIKKEDVPGIDSREALDGSELHGVRACGDGLEAGAVEVVEVVIGSDPDAAGGVEGEGEDEGFLDAIGGGEAVEFGAVVTEEAVFGSDPEKALLVLDYFEDVEVAEAFVLTVVAKGEVLGSGWGGCEEAEQKQEQQPLEGQGSGCCVLTSLGPSGTAQRGPRGGTSSILAGLRCCLLWVTERRRFLQYRLDSSL